MLKIRFKDKSRVRLMIAEKGESLRGFSDRVGISQGYLSQLLLDKKQPSPKTACKIADGLNVDVKDIFLIESIDESIDKEAN